MSTKKAPVVALAKAGDYCLSGMRLARVVSTNVLGAILEVDYGDGVGVPQQPGPVYVIQKRDVSPKVADLLGVEFVSLIDARETLAPYKVAPTA